MMDRSALARKRRQEAGQPTSKPPVRIPRDKRSQQEGVRRPQSGRIRAAKDSTEIARVPRKLDETERPSQDEDARHFTVANVGQNGVLYLKPSRMAPTHLTHPFATPLDTSDEVDADNPEQAGRRESSVSGTWTPRGPPKQSKPSVPVPLPPLSMANVHPRRRTRSHSFSTINDAAKATTFDSAEIQLLLNGQEPRQRPKSSVDLTSGLLDLRIPHYRLGTPRFSDMGTAYLHNSIYASTSGDVRSSVLSKAEYDRLFPAPPGRESRPGMNSRTSSGSRHLHPSQATHSLTPTRTPPRAFQQHRKNNFSIVIYDKVEANINDPSLVRYSVSTGRITAATPARLIAQITSPLFLDYELLADFFLTFRSFLSCHDLLEYLLTRMKWALANNSDAGRIVRVRTFVALRHWILNYFADDLVPNFQLRQQFCDLVNELAQALRQRSDGGGTDMNVIGELKKCWRRTCATFWPIQDPLDTSPDVDILPGDAEVHPLLEASTTSLPLSVQHNSGRMDFRRSSQIQLPVAPENGRESRHVRVFSPDQQLEQVRTASIPTSAMSAQSMEVLSCSVPFLRAMVPLKEMKEKFNAIRPPGPEESPPLSGKPDRSHWHKRSGSFSDALRDKRMPLPSGQPESVNIRSLQSMTFTGGLVRGLLLQPCPSTVDMPLPLSPAVEIPEVRFGGLETTSAHERQNAGMKKIVGDVRRALSSRKRSPASSHRSTNSSDSRSSTQALTERAGPTSNWQQLQGPPRVDLLGEIIQGSYKEAFEDALEANAGDSALQDEEVKNKEVNGEFNQPAEPVLTPDLNRLNSHVTTGSRSIVIVDDTGVPEVPVINGAIPSVSSWSSNMAPKPLFGSQEMAFDGMDKDIEKDEYQSGRGSYMASPSDGHQQRSSEPAFDELLTVPESWQAGVVNGDPTTGDFQARKSSGANPPVLEMEPMRNQLRRRPGGGDLKTADHVHDLEPADRPETWDSYSTFSQAIASSGVPSHDLHGTHFSGHEFNGLRLPLSMSERKKKDSLGLLPTHSSQPNMRPSFEKQVSNLARMPDRPSDGGIEDALAKLEGKPGSPSASETTVAERDASTEMAPLARNPRSRQIRVANATHSTNASNLVEEDDLRSPRTDRQGASIYHMSDSDVEAGQFVNGASQGEADPDAEASQADELPMQSVDFADGTDKAVTFVDGDEKTTGNPSTPPRSGTSQGSFLLDDDESLSDISTEIAEQSGDESLGVRSFFFDDTVEDEAASAVHYRPPPTPPSTAPPEESLSGESRSLDQPGNSSEQHRTLKEAASAPKLLASKQTNLDFQQMPDELRRARTSPSRREISHLPFVLGFESDVIAEQLTIIEKDALDEVDWRDLVGLKWQHKPCQIRNWVDFLKRDGANGIDIVVARFNLVVKWVVSECMLTEAPTERARCITKYIHVAVHAHRLRNYASMYQITLALLSSDMAHLHKTWALVAPAEKQMLARLEKLCQPRNNFHQLRAEMESVATEKGCIPFIGLYTHDLMFNSQKPSRIEPPAPGVERLINFERYQTAATIVKSLLRLIEASSNYIFRPHPEVLSRCLWLAALEENEITTRSKTLEQ